MKWTAQQIRFRLLSPLHIGWRKSGNLQQTRPYVTGHSLWGALTARLTRDSGKDNYEEVGQWVDERLAFTYFYPSDCLSCVRLWPWEESWDEFAWTYLGSYVSTSLADGHAAEEGSLHETEFIAPRTREGKPVYLIGYIFQREDWSDLALDLDATLNKLQIGGERGYGWGRLNLLSGYEREPIKKDAPVFGKFKVAAAANRPVLEADSEQARLLAHACATGSEVNKQCEPLIGRITDSAGAFGQSHSKATVCWIPGEKVTASDKFLIQPKGLWKPIWPVDQPDNNPGL